MIKIIDNFFDDVLFKNIQNHVSTKLCFEPRYLPDTTEKTKENHYGSRFVLTQDPNLFKTFIKQCEKTFKIKIKETYKDSGVDLRNLDFFIPHDDVPTGSKINILIMIKGRTAVNNGTVFYHKEKDKSVLDIHVGFRENRAVLFPSSWVHSAHARKEDDVKRYTATLFVTDYEE
jgi:bifunctional N-acetylglucosamine-1-phosphate-uridyltransferase/glucosamine-1-phosphate-acetyltransferase GlmU-like protein